MIGTLQEIANSVNEVLSAKAARELNRLISRAEKEYWKLLSENSSLEEELAEARERPVRVCELVDILAQWARTADKRHVEQATRAIAAGIVGGAWLISDEVAA